MSAFDSSCTKTTADSTWKYNKTVFVNIKINNTKNQIDTDSSICSNCFENDLVLSEILLENLNKCHLS